MFCPKCGKQVDESDAFCRSCGFAVSAEKPEPGEPPARTASSTPIQDAEQPIRRSGEATASLVLGLFSFIPVVGLLAVIFGHLAKASIRRSGGRLLGRGMAAFGLVLGYLGLLGWIAWAVVWAVIIAPNRFAREQRASDRGFALTELRTINTAATTYASTYGRGYPPTLAALGPPAGKASYNSGDLSEKAAGLISGAEAAGKSFGYRLTYVAGKPDKRGRIGSYGLRAGPINPRETMHYFIDETGVIRQETDKEANAESSPLLGSSE